MSRKLIVGVVVLGVVLVAWLVLRGRGDDTKPAGERPRSAAVTPTPTAPPPTTEAPPAPRVRAPRWTLDTDVEGPLRLEGQVVDGDGHGVGGAEVWLSSVPPRTEKTDDDGTFSFDKLVGRAYSLSATRGELIGGPVRYKLTAQSDPVVLRLGEAAAVRVTVIDEAARPLASAEVKVGERTAKTSEQGIARVAPIQPGFVEVEASAAGYAPNTGYTTVGAVGATGDLTITLHKGYPVSGRVLDEAGKPVGKVRVTAGEGLLGETIETGGATTDDKGAFTIAAVASGRHTLSAVDGEHAPAQSSPITVAERPITGVEIVMRAGGVLAGRVVDGAHKPVPYATVRVAGARQQLWEGTPRQATSDASGAFELRGLERIAHEVRAESDTAASKVVAVDLTSKLRVDGLELVLDVGGSIAGIVVDELGAPVPEVSVNVFPDVLGGASTDSLALAGLSSTTTGGDGAFVVRGLPDGSYRLWAARQSRGFGGWGQQSTRAKAGDKDVRITLPAPGSLTGKLVVAGTGNPPRHATIAVGVQMPTPVADGAFQIKELAPGPYDVTFRGLEFAELIQHDVKIEPGKVTDLGTITVTRGRKLAGKVVDKTGAPVAGAKIKVGAMLFSSADAAEQSEGLESMAGIRSAVSDQDGVFTLVGLPPKANNAMAEHTDRGRSLAVPIPEGAEDPPPVTLALRGFGSVTGKVTRKGEPMPNVAIGESSKGGGAQGQFTRTSADGTYTLAKVTEGSHVINVMQAAIMSMKSTSVTVQVTAGKQTTANIEIPQGEITATVQVKPLPNQKVDAAQIFLFAGSVNVTNGKQLVDGMFQSAVQGTKFWLGADKPAPDFAELIAGNFSICALPITGDLSDMQFQQRLQENLALLKVYCKAVRVAPSPTAQTFTVELPAMTPLPAPAPPPSK
jgi:protocatechuate 3,4-dioxygenase beta subunit